MASSGSTSVTVTQWDTLKFNWAQASQSVANNTTVVSWTLQLIASSSGRISSTASKDWSVTVNGTKYSGTNSIGIAANSVKTLASGKTTITHNTDGTKSFSYSFSQEFGITFSGSSIGTKSGSGTGTLNTIPRATTPTLSSSSVDMGTAVTINTPRASSSFTHDLAYAFSGGSYVSIATGVATSRSWTVPISLAGSIPNATSGTVTIRCITKNGSTTVGTKTVLLTAKVPSSVVPTVGTVTTSEATAGIAAQFGAYVQSKSKINTTITASGSYGSTIKSYSTTFQGKNYSGASWTSNTINNKGSLSLVTTVTDSRGRTAKKTTTISVTAYTPPQIAHFRAIRCDAEGNPQSDGIYAQVSYSYTVASVGGKNTASAKVEWKLSSATSYQSTPLLTDTATASYNTTTVTSPTFSTENQYNLRLTVSDWFGTSVTYGAVIPSGDVILDILADGKGIALLEFCKAAGVTIRGGIPRTPIALTEGQDLDALTEPGYYVIPTTAVSGTLLNKPYTGTATGNIQVLQDGIQGQLRQICRKGSKTDGAIYERCFYSSAWGEWFRVYSGAGTILWSGGLYMSASQSAQLSEPISRQPNGIVLVFSRYSASTVQDYHFNSFFVHKALVAAQPGVGHQFMMSTDGSWSVLASKYVYINDTNISGNANNEKTGTANGITYANNGFVLRYVIGV